MEFREVLGQLRRERGLNQEQLAEQIGVSRQAVSKWETGEASPDLPNLLALADALDVSLDALCGRAEREAAVSPVAEAPTPKKRRGWIVVLIAAVIIIFALSTFAILALNYVRPETAPSETTSEATHQQAADLISGLEFSLNNRLSLTCRFFCYAGGSYDYEVQLLDKENNMFRMETDYEGGLVTASVSMPEAAQRQRSFTAILVLTPKFSDPIIIPLASDMVLDASANSVTWTPVPA